MNKIKFTIFLFIYISVYVSAQINITDHGGNFPEELLKSDYETKDIDNDGTTDSLYYDFQTRSIVFLLSSRDYIPFSELFDPTDNSGKTDISAVEKGFTIYISYMRAFDLDTYHYEPATERFRLVGHMHESLGNAAGDGSGTYSHDFTSGQYTADWNYFDTETDSLVSLPTINLSIDNPRIYFNDSISYNIPRYDLFEEYKREYTPPVTDTVMVVGFDHDYDYMGLIARKGDISYYSSIMFNSEELFYRGDIISVTLSTVCYEEPGNSSFVISHMITDMKKIIPDNLSVFYRNNKKKINYYDVHTDSWRYE